MNVVALEALARPLTPLRVRDREEHPRVVVDDVAGRPRGAGHILVFANEKGGVGKSTLAFHTTIALCDAGYRVAAIDLDCRQRSFARTLDHRSGTARTLGIALPSPRHIVVEHQSGGMLCQEIGRIGSDCDYVVIDVAGHDSPGARRAIALADTLVTPINSSFIDLDLLGHMKSDFSAVRGPGCFAQMVDGLRAERAVRGARPMDWVVVPNRLRRGRSQNQRHFDQAMAMVAEACDFRIASGMAERVAYRELFLLGLTHFDFPRIPGLSKGNGQARGEIQNFVAELALPEAPLLARMRARG